MGGLYATTLKGRMTQNRNLNIANATDAHLQGIVVDFVSETILRALLTEQDFSCHQKLITISHFITA